RHMVGLPTIHMIGKEWKIPFDVAPYRAITFSRIDYADIEAARDALRSTVEEVIKPGFVVENPITHARGVVKIQEHASDELRVILDEMQSLRVAVKRAEVIATVASQNAKAALGSRDINALAQPSLWGPATEPPMGMGKVYGLTLSSSNQTLDEILTGALK